MTASCSWVRQTDRWDRQTGDLVSLSEALHTAPAHWSAEPLEAWHKQYNIQDISPHNRRWIFRFTPVGYVGARLLKPVNRFTAHRNYPIETKLGGMILECLHNFKSVQSLLFKAVFIRIELELGMILPSYQYARFFMCSGEVQHFKFFATSFVHDFFLAFAEISISSIW